MKQKDLALILVIVFVSGVLSFLISNKFISSGQRNEKAAKVDPITADFRQPNKRYFNEQSVNPTALIQIENNANQQPVR